MVSNPTNQTTQQPSPGASLADGLPNLHEGEQPKALPLEKFRYVFPESVRKTKAPYKDPKVLVLREVTEPEMEVAEKLGGLDNRKTVFEAVKLSMHAVGYKWDPKKQVCEDLRIVNHGDSEADILWGQWGLKIKFLCVEAFRSINQTTKEQDADFLGSMTPV